MEADFGCRAGAVAESPRDGFFIVNPRPKEWQKRIPTKDLWHWRAPRAEWQ